MATVIGPRVAQVIALWQSGELAAAARGTKTLAEWAGKLGLTAAALESAVLRARRLGHPIPDYRRLQLGQVSLTQTADSDNDSFHDEEPTLSRPAIGMHTATMAGQTMRGPLDTETDRDIGKPDISHVHGDGCTYEVGGRWSCEYQQITQQPIAEPQQQPIVPPNEGIQNPDLEKGHQGGDVFRPDIRKGPHLEAFDAVGGNDMLPAHGPGVRRSTLLRDGEPVLQWIKNPGGTDPQAITESIKRALVDLPFVEPAPAPCYTDDELLAVYKIGDAHVGMLAWEPEAGENFDLKIAERNLVTAVDRLSVKAPSAKRALIANVGDFIHSDGPKGQTTRGTPVDVDGRWPKVIETAMRIQRRMVELALRKHEHVTVINARGNHDETAAVIMALALAQFYEHEPRVHIDTSPEFFHWYRFERNLIGVHHSEKVKTPSDLLGVMAVDRAKDWGETEHRSMILGHLHHLISKMEKTVRFDWVPTLAGADAWHRAMGYRACQELHVDVHHAQLGLIDRHIVGIGEVRALQEAS